jgi:single-strand DNA-binding protein
MPRGINKVILLGNISNDPDFRMLPSNSTGVATASLATNESYRDQQGQMQDRVEWHRLVFWGRLAEIARDYLRKGSLVYVEGKMRTRSYDDKQGIKRYVTEIQVLEMQMLSSKNSNQQQPVGNNYSQPQQQMSNYSQNQNVVKESSVQDKFSHSTQNNNVSSGNMVNQASLNSNPTKWSMPEPNSFKVAQDFPQTSSSDNTSKNKNENEPDMHPFADDDVPF